MKEGRVVLQGQPSISSIRIVLVEDRPQMLKLLEEMLNAIDGVEIVATAASETTGLEALQSSRPDLAIIDLELGDGNGLNILKSWYGQGTANKKVEIVVFSNYANVVIQKRCIAQGATAFFDKSFQLDELLEFVKQKTQRA
ncbi:MAG: response regulator [Limnobacter sp.]|nr:response regulator [Limnobacter sp.]